nr:MAG: ORF1 [TTV-like mini virus]
MPWYFRKNYRNRFNWNNYRRTQRYRRRRFRYRRPRTTLRRRFYQRQRRVRKLYFRKRKLKRLKLTEWQPEKINKCKIKGIFQLFECGPNRISYNWTDYMNSYTPEHWNGGGGWSQLKFSLGSLYEQRELVRNVWTKSNIALPLVRYCGAKFKFYRTQDVDYIVNYNRCYPMVDTESKHTNSQPSAMLMYKNKIIVPSFKTAPHKRKTYIKKYIKPPAQMINKWYFQQDICDTGLLLLTTTAMSLDRFFLNPKSLSNSITIPCLNTKVFQSRNFQQTELGTTQWKPKDNYYIYGTHHGDPENDTLAKLIYLGQTQSYTEGEPIGQQDWSQYSNSRLMLRNFGNPLHTNYIHGQDNLWIGNDSKSPDKLFQDKSKRNEKVSQHLTLMSQNIIEYCRYTPNKDTGLGNEVYFLKNTRNESGWDAPTDEKLVLRGYPLWLAWWGYPDWQKKLKIMQQIDFNYIAVFKSDFLDIKLPGYVPLDQTFIHGHSPYEPDIPPLPADNQHWFPRFKYQTTTIDNICKTGPGTVKTSTNSIEAHCFYSFYFKWGGCPRQLENIEDPCNQPKYPIPSNILQTNEIQNPRSSPQKEIYPFDFRRDLLTKSAADRITKDSKTTTTLFTDAARWSAEPLQRETSEEEDQTQISETETETLQQLIQQQRKDQQYLKRRIHKLMRTVPTLKYINLK